MNPEKLAQARCLAGLSQEQAAKKLHMSTYTIHLFESGRLDPTPAQIQRFADLYKVNSDWLEDKENPIDPNDEKLKAISKVLSPEDFEKVVQILNSMRGSNS